MNEYNDNPKNKNKLIISILVAIALILVLFVILIIFTTPLKNILFTKRVVEEEAKEITTIEEIIEKTTEETTKEQTEKPTEETPSEETKETEEKTTKEEITDKEIKGVLAKAMNYAGKQEQGGMEIEIIRILFADKKYTEKETGGKFSDCSQLFDGVNTLGEIMLRVTNNSNKILTIYPWQGIILIGNEQINPIEYHCQIYNMEYTDGEIYPGITRIGGFWFGIRRSTWDEINKVKYIIDAPSDEDYTDVGEDFQFEINLSEKNFEPMPEELLP